MGGDQGRQVAVGQRIPVEDQEGSALQKGRGLLDAAAGALERGLVRVRKAQAEARPVPERVHDLLAEVVQVDDDVGNPVPLEEQEIPLEDRPSCDRQQDFGGRVGERPQAGPETRCQNHRLHRGGQASSGT